jgi:CRP-like cAMP-binding protein
MTRPSWEVPELRDIFLTNGQKHTYSPGETIVEKGAIAGQVGFLSNGRVRTICQNFSGSENTLFYLDADSILCSEGLLETAQVNVTVLAVEPCVVYFLSGQRFLDLWQQGGYSTQRLLTHFIKKLMTFSDYICCAHFQESDKKVAYFLYSCCDGYTGKPIHYSNDQIAAVVGLNRVSVNRILNGFAKDGLVELGYRSVRVLDPDRLALIFDNLGYFIDG